MSERAHSSCCLFNGWEIEFSAWSAANILEWGESEGERKREGECSWVNECLYSPMSILQQAHNLFQAWHLLTFLTTISKPKGPSCTCYWFSLSNSRQNQQRLTKPNPFLFSKACYFAKNCCLSQSWTVTNYYDGQSRPFTSIIQSKFNISIKS